MRSEKPRGISLLAWTSRFCQFIERLTEGHYTTAFVNKVVDRLRSKSFECIDRP